MIHPDTEVQFISEEVGYGVVATRLIPRGTITWVQDELDRIYTPKEVSAMGHLAREMVEKYTFRNNKGNFVMCWDTAKYVNHSFKSNCLSTAYDFEIAIRDIHPGEELTDDYGYLNVTEEFNAKNEGTTRTTVYPDDLANFHQEWDEQLRETFPFIKKVEQPLQQLIPSEITEKLQNIFSGREEPDSILNLYYNTEE
ncbi:MAG: SET domain-containing protein [Gillisia sp.]